MQSDTEKFFENQARQALGRLNIPLEMVGYYTKAQKKLLYYVAEGYHLWSVEAKPGYSGLGYRFNFSKLEKSRRSVTLTGKEVDGLKKTHLHFFTPTGLIVIDEDTQEELELDIAYEEDTSK